MTDQPDTPRLRLVKAEPGQSHPLDDALANVMKSIEYAVDAVDRDPKMSGFYSFGGYVPHPEETREEREARAARMRCVELHGATEVSPYMLDVNETAEIERGMTAAELIAVLQTLPPETVINLEDNDSDYGGGDYWATMVVRTAEGVTIR